MSRSSTLGCQRAGVLGSFLLRGLRLGTVRDQQGSVCAIVLRAPVTQRHTGPLPPLSLLAVLPIADHHVIHRQRRVRSHAHVSPASSSSSHPRWHTHRSCYSHFPCVSLPTTLRQQESEDWIFFEFFHLKVACAMSQRSLHCHSSLYTVSASILCRRHNYCLCFSDI